MLAGSHQSQIIVFVFAGRLVTFRGRDRIPELFLLTGWVFFSGCPPDYLPLLAPTGRKCRTDSVASVSEREGEYRVFTGHTGIRTSLVLSGLLACVFTMSGFPCYTC